MNDHQYYREDNNDLKSEPKFIKAKVQEITLDFKTDNGVFSKDFLDYATKILLENIEINNNLSVLDIGCGYGPIGIYLAKKYNAKATMIDINERALGLAIDNVKLNKVEANVIKSDCLDEVLSMRFDVCVTNPPIRAGKQVIYKMYEDSYKVLNKNGLLFLVIQQKHGAPSTIKKLTEIYPSVDVIYKKKGFFVIKCRKIS